MTGPRQAHLAIMSLLFALACSAEASNDSASATPASAERDSAGIRIVEHGLSGFQMSPDHGWLLAPEPELVIGRAVGDDDAHELHRVTGATLLDDGRIAVGVGSVPEVRLYDAEGRFVRRVGRRGNGPGEFQQLTGPWRVEHGRFAVFDVGQQRLTIFDTTGAVAGEGSYRGGGEGMPMIPVDGTSDGRLLGEMQAFSQATAGLSRPEVTYVYFDTSAVAQAVADPLPGRELFVGNAGRDGMRALGSSPFARAPLAAACGGYTAIAENSRYEVRLLDESGSTRTIVRGDRQGERITDDVFRAFLRDRLGDEAPVTEDMIASLRQTTVQERLPVLARLQCDEAGNLWIEEFQRPGVGSRQLVSFDADGRYRGEVELPADVTLLRVRDGRLLSLVRDDVDVEYVEMRRITTSRRNDD